MSAPRPTFTASRQNAGGYGVTVRFYAPATSSTSSRIADVLAKIRGSVDVKSQAFFDREFAPKLRRPVILSGTVNSDGSLNIEPELWRARHYKRAVMGGAGVYSWGLWAFLSARRVFGTALACALSREHIETHRVRIDSGALAAIENRILYPLTRDEALRLRNDPINARKRQGFKMVYRYSTHWIMGPTGLEIKRPKWLIQHYRRCVMRGAGVYQAGLRAHLASRRRAQLVEHKQDSLGANRSDTLKRFFAPKPSPTPLPFETTLTTMSPKARIRRARLLGVSRSALRGKVPLMRELTPSMRAGVFYIRAVEACARQTLGAKWASAASAIRLRRIARRFLSLNHRESSSKRFAQIFARLIARGDRYRAYLAQLVRPRRAPRYTPRPLYSRAIPPAAPLAPPVL